MSQQEAGPTELEDFAEVLRGRRTIEQFLQKEVPYSVVNNAIEAATWAPNHRVTEPWTFYHLGPKTVQKCLDLIRDITTEKKDAKAGEFRAKSWSEKPGWLLVSCRMQGNELQQREDYAACATAVQNFMLYMWKAGVGTKWTSGDITRDPRLFEIVGMGEDETVVALIWYGYPKLIPEQSRKPLDRVLVERP